MKKGGFGKNKPLLITIVALVVLAAMILASAGRGTAIGLKMRWVRF